MSEHLQCVVLGGSGFLGQALCRRLVLAGYKVRSISRSGRPKGDFEAWHSNVEWVAAPIGSDLAIRALDDAKIVYHLASSTYPSTSNLDMSFDLESNTLATVPHAGGRCRFADREVRLRVFRRNGLRDTAAQSHQGDSP